ncbi:MAG: DsrE family protein [Chloroflexota bacterium]|nr:DsrE family protein [Chloroflexota bacterium]
MASSGVTRRTAAAVIGTIGVGFIGGTRGIAAQATPAADAVPADFGVVFHVSADDHWPYALSNLENLAASHPDARIRVVVDGVGIYALQGESDVTARLAPLASRGVHLAVCPNALHEHGVPDASMPSYADLTLGGVVALVAAQREGYAYIKP